MMPMEFEQTAKDLIKEMSKPTNFRLANEEDLKKGLTDSYGRPFNRKLHIHKRGKPLLTVEGFCRCKKGKKPTISQICNTEKYQGLMQDHQGPEPGQDQDIEGDAGRATGQGDDENLIPSEGIKIEAIPEGNNVPLGIASAEIVFILGQAIGGEEWTPNENERAYMANAWEQYLRAKGFDDLPPGLILVTALISYAAPRFRRPKTQGRLKRFFVWVKVKCLKKKPNQYKDEEAA